MKSTNARRTVRWTSAALLAILSIALTAPRDARASYGTPMPIKAPTVSIGTVTASSIAVSWAPVQYANGYQIQMANGTVYRTTATSYVIPNLAAGTLYFFTVAGRSDTNAGSTIGGASQASATTATPTTTTTTTTTPAWTQIGTGTTFTSASIGSATSYGGIVGGKYYAWNGTSFVADGIALTQVAYGNDGSRWGVASTGTIYRWSTSWGTVAGALKQISVGNASNVWGVNSTGSIYKWNGTGWMQMPGTFASVSVAADGTVWALQPNDSIWRWNGSAWVQFGGALRWISVGGAANVWGVNAGGSVYKVNAAGTGWDMPGVPSGTFVGVSAASDGSTFLIRNDGTLWKR